MKMIAGAALRAFAKNALARGYGLVQRARNVGDVRVELLVERLDGIGFLAPVMALARRLRPQARFVWARLTPGGLGLEFTTLTAVLSVGLFVLIGLEKSHLPAKWWWLPVPAVLGVGVSLGLPLFLYLREIRSEQRAA